jgi:threonylcarbamoyladenosine tRNA methylthiotransferase MtaB
MATAVYYTLGCKLNFAETSAIAETLSGCGIRKALPGEKADICVINTCSVTALADKKCRQAIRRIGKRNPGAFMIVTGCYAQLRPQEVAGIEGVDLVLGAGQKQDILPYINRFTGKGTEGAVIVPASPDMRTFSPSCSTGDRTRRFLKVQDGCDYYCTYCTIPLARGRSRNGTIAALTEQAREAARTGGKEIVLTGVNIGDFGKSTGESFIDLLRSLDEVEGIARYRISSIEPDLLTAGIIDFVAHSQRFAPHFHIPLQSGSDAVLQLMRRRYDTALFRRRIEQIQSVMPQAFIGVDVIVGMRGETEEWFEETLRFIDSLPVSQLHVFSYSERPDTQALKIDYAVDEPTRHARSRQLLDISGKKWHDFYESRIGREAVVLFEHRRKGNLMQGFTENYIRVEAPYNASLVNEPRRIRLGGWNEGLTALGAGAFL